ncbi:hypothetical protein OROGR_026924 [Orobanche gracilis]
MVYSQPTTVRLILAPTINALNGSGLTKGFALLARVEVRTPNHLLIG